MQEQIIRETGLSTRLGKKELQEVDKLVQSGLFLNRADFLRQAAREKLSSIKILRPRNVTKEQAKNEILEYLKTNGKSYTSDISDDLELDYEFVELILHELKGKERVD